MCKGDSGGPLVLHFDGTVGKEMEHYYQIGVTQGTYNLGCDNSLKEVYPSIFTRVENIDINNFIRRAMGLKGTTNN